MDFSRVLVAATALIVFNIPSYAAERRLGAGLNTPTAADLSPQGFGGATRGSAQLFAVVNGADGSRARGKGDAGTPGGAKLGVGTYDIRFSRDITDCSFTGNIGGTGFDSPFGFVSFTKRSGAGNGVFVQTRNQTGALADLNFHLYVDC
ncbi:hypothetical protein [Mesorhizobium sp. J428]|uniref:hypothetical protein n=1 Tax=Mesorhizobium sp. J428 TaxID=2898440 RepID=UPI002151D423|nr:hypothetical protein [Mesorhizobium sp. J428]MCR5856013.1 hypothetical protein [Mesorhizobium sp. J428]